MDIILLFLAKPLDKHGITLVHITYPRLGFFVATYAIEAQKIHDSQEVYFF